MIKYGDMRTLYILLVCCSVWFTGEARRKSCDSKLDLSINSSSLSEGMGDTNSRSLSPWTWRATTVATQIPLMLWEAECSSSVCLFPHSRPGDEHTDTEVQSLGLSAVPIYQDVLVLERTQGKRCFTTSIRRLAVGCTCVRAQTTTAS